MDCGFSEAEVLIVRVSLQVVTDVTLGVDHASTFGNECQVVSVNYVSLRLDWLQFKTAYSSTFTYSIEFSSKVELMDFAQGCVIYRAEVALTELTLSSVFAVLGTCLVSNRTRACRIWS